MNKKTILLVLFLILLASSAFAAQVSVNGKLLKTHRLEQYRERLVRIVQGFKEGKYLELNARELKKEKQGLVEKIKGSK